MEYFRKVQQLKRQRVGGNVEPNGEHEVRNDQAQIAEAKQQVQDFYEKQKVILAEK